MNPHEGNSSSTDAAHSKPKKYMVFELAHLRYAAPLSSVKEVIALPNLTPVPGMPEYFKGLINLRGKIISTIDLRIRLKLSTESKGKNKRPTVIITEVDNESLGLVVDDVIEVISLYDNQVDRQIEKLEESLKQGVVGAARMDQRELTLLLDLTKIAPLQELKIMAKSS